MRHHDSQDPFGGNNSIPRIMLFLISAYLLLEPFYIFPSGMPQPSDVLVVLAIGHILFAGSPFDLDKGPIHCLTALVAYVLLVNLCWAALLGDWQVALYGTYYLYNALVFVVFVCYGHRDSKSLSLAVVYGLIGAIGAQLVVVYVLGNGTPTRATGSFNNPNQLGYFALLALTIILTVHRRGLAKPKTLVYFGCVGAVLLCLLSLSKAAILSAAVLLAFQFLVRPTMILGIGVVFLSSFLVLDIGNIFESVTSRIETIGSQTDDSLSGRGYGRILEHPEYLFFGAGEGAYYRFSPLGQEIHSALGTLLFCYGSIGFCLFILFLRSLVRRAKVSEALFLLPALLYGTVHQGLRFSAFWVLLAMFYIARSGASVKRVKATQGPVTWRSTESARQATTTETQSTGDSIRCNSNT